MMGFNLAEVLKNKICAVIPCEWSDEAIRYLDILVGRSNVETVELNISALTTYPQERCLRWKLLPIFDGKNRPN